jgi:RNA polymerase sigma-70 factor (TIGR02943 family)
MPPEVFRHDVAAAKSYLLRFARQQLRNDAWADDVVAETMLAALEKPENFHGKSSLNTWLVGILKFKIIDCLRAQSREASSSMSNDESTSAEDFWLARDAELAQQSAETQPLDCPHTSLQSSEFLAVVDACLKKMPDTMGRVFVLREWMEYSTDEICAELSLTPSNVWVLLHRARLRLREHLQQTWFENRTTAIA